MSARKIFKNILAFLFISVCLAPLFAAHAAETVAINNPLPDVSQTDPIGTLAGVLIKSALGLSGVFALIAFVYGGVLYTMSGFGANNVKKGQEVMKNAVIGLIIIFTSYMIINFVFTQVLGVGA